MICALGSPELRDKVGRDPDEADDGTQPDDNPKDRKGAKCFDIHLFVPIQGSIC